MDNREWKIPLAGLKEKVYYFEYELDQTFFDESAEPLMKDPKVHVHLSFDKRHEPYVLDFELSGDFEDLCDRCGATIRVPLLGDHRLYVEFGAAIEGEENDQSEVVYLSREAHEIDLYDHVHDYVILSIPMIKHCRTGIEKERCDQKVRQYSGNEKASPGNDPRWAALKNLKQ